jgi:hypothetical protein
MRSGARGVFVVALALVGIGIVPAVVHANGDEEEYPANPAQPISPTPGRPLPFPVKDEPTPVAPPLVGPKAASDGALFVSMPTMAKGLNHDTVLGAALRQYQALVVRKSQVERGKVTLPVASVAYYVEVSPGAQPLVGDVLYLSGSAKSLVDVEQTIVVRKDVTVAYGDSFVLGSSVIRYSGRSGLAGTFAAGMSTESLGGLDWGRYGQGAFEVSTTQLGWRQPIFRNGLEQGLVSEATPKQVKFGWISSTRTDGIVLADKEERGGKLKAGDDVALAGGRHVKVVTVSPARTVSLETPDGPKTLQAPPDPKFLPEDTESRKKVMVLGKDWAVAMNPGLSDFTKGEVHLYVYSGTRSFRNGEMYPGATGWRVWPTALPNGSVVGLLVTNDQPLSLDPKSSKLEGPDQSFTLVTTWKDEDLASFRVEHRNEKSAEVPVAGRNNLDLVAGGGPTASSILGRASIGVSAPSAEATDTTPAPASSAAAPPPAPTWRESPVAWVKPHLYWVLGGFVFGLLLALLVGLGRRRKQSWE